MSPNKRLRKITIIGFGGTIGAKSKDPTATAGYECGKLSVEELIKRIPNLTEKAQIKVINLQQEGKEGSPDITSSDRLNAMRVMQNELDDGADAIVGLHGTDSLLLTACTAELAIKTTKTIIFTGASLPSSCVGADGDKNMICSVNLGIRGLPGVYIVFDFEIFQARYTRKWRVASSSPFHSMTGVIGVFKDMIPIVLNKPTMPEDQWFFDVSKMTALPFVVIFHYQEDVNEKMFFDATAKAKGVVLVGVGDGSWPKSLGQVISKHAETIPVVASSNSFSYIMPKHCYGLNSSCIGSGYLGPSNSLILLRMALAAGYSHAAIREIFEQNIPTDLRANSLRAKL